MGSRSRALGWSLLLALACGGPVETASPPQEGASPGAGATAAADREARSDAGPTAACPPGAQPGRLSIEAIESLVTWCDKSGPEGTLIRHGPWERRVAGVLLESGRYEDGEQTGEWRLHWASGEPQSAGLYQAGQRIGTWTVWDRDGRVIREIDYGAPEEESVAAVAEAPTPEPEQADEVASSEEDADPDAAAEEERAEPSFTLLVENFHENDVIFALEPFAEEYWMAPGDMFEVAAFGPNAGDLRLESSPEAIVVWASEDADIEIRFEGNELSP